MVGEPATPVQPVMNRVGRWEVLKTADTKDGPRFVRPGLPNLGP